MWTSPVVFKSPTTRESLVVLFIQWAYLESFWVSGRATKCVGYFLSQKDCEVMGRLLLDRLHKGEKYRENI